MYHHPEAFFLQDQGSINPYSIKFITEKIFVKLFKWNSNKAMHYFVVWTQIPFSINVKSPRGIKNGSTNYFLNILK